MILLIKSIGVGFLIAAPYGPVGFLTIDRTLNRGIKAGVMTFLGSMLVDMFFVFILVWGVTEVTDFLHRFEVLIKSLSVLLLFGMGISMFLKKETLHYIDTSKQDYTSDFVSAFAITLANPLAYLGFVPLFGLIGFSIKGATFTQSIPVIVGVIVGIFACWFALVEVIARVRNLMSSTIIKKVTQGVGLFMIAAATYILLSITVLK